VQCTDAALIVMPGDDNRSEFNHSLWSPVSQSTVRYFNEGGVENIVNALQFVAIFVSKQPTTTTPTSPSRWSLYRERVGNSMSLSGIGDNGVF